MRQLIAATSKMILSQAHGKIDVVPDYCRWVPATMVEEYFGLDEVDKKALIGHFGINMMFFITSRSIAILPN